MMMLLLLLLLLQITFYFFLLTFLEELQLYVKFRNGGPTCIYCS